MLQIDKIWRNILSAGTFNFFILKVQNFKLYLIVDYYKLYYYINIDKYLLFLTNKLRHRV